MHATVNQTEDAQNLTAILLLVAELAKRTDKLGALVGACLWGSTTPAPDSRRRWHHNYTPMLYLAKADFG